MKEKEMEKLKKECLEFCYRHPLYRQGTHPVFGEGSLNAKIMFIGEAPGYYESISGHPFCGAAGKVLDELLAYFNAEHIVVINDGSRDNTKRIAKEKGVHVLTHLINRGLGGALGTGISYALKKGAEIIITFDADGQHLVSDALKVMKPVVEGKADLAIGSRLMGDISEMPFVKRLGNFILDAITAVFARKYVSDSQSGLRCLNKECASKIKITCDRYAVSSEIIIEASKNGCRIAEVPIKAVYTSYSKKKGTNVMEGIKIAVQLLLDKLR